MPLALSSFSFSKSSVNLLLPPSMTRSPLSSRSASLATVSRVGAPVRHHDPHDARRLELLDHVGQGARVGDRLVAVVADDLVAGAAEPLAHVAAHLAQTDQTQLHVDDSSWLCGAATTRCWHREATSPRHRRGQATPGSAQAREAHRHEHVAVRGVGLAVRLGLAGEHRGPRGWVNESRLYGVPTAPRPSSRNCGLKAISMSGPVSDGLDGLGGLGVVAGAGLDGDLALGEPQPHRGVALGDQRHALDGLDERRRS